MNIYEKILEIMKSVQYLSKDDHVQFNTTDYKALSEEKVTTIMRKQMIEKKLVVFPVQQTRQRTGQITSVDVTYRIVNVEDPTEFIEVVSSGDGADSQDKGAGKAMTYAYKYMWLRTFALPTGEDPDHFSSEELDEKAKKPDILCPVCHEPIKGLTWKGKKLQPQEVLDKLHACHACYTSAKKSEAKS